MQKAMVAALVGITTVATVAGLGVASLVTSDLSLTVDGQTVAIRALGRPTVNQVLVSREIKLTGDDFVTPNPDTIVSDGLDIQVAHARPFTAIIDGQTTTVKTTATTVGGALAVLGVDAETAVLSVPSQTGIAVDGTTVTVTTSKLVSLRADGTTLYTQTTDSTVEELLTSRNISLGPIDRVNPSLDTSLANNMAVVVQRVTVTTSTETVDLPFKTQKITNSNMDQGAVKVTTPGVKGKAEQVWQITLVDGVEESRTLLSQTTLTQPVTQVEQVGVKGPPLPPPRDVSAAHAQDIARGMMAKYGFDDDKQFGCLVRLWDRESHWNYKSENSRTGAYGIPQAVPGSKMRSAGADWRTNPATQIKWGLGYIKGRYGTPCAAWDHSQSTGWY